MEKTTDIELIEAIDAVLERTGIKPSAFGDLAINDANLVSQLRAGRDLRTSTRARVLECIGLLQSKVELAPDSCLGSKSGKQSDDCQLVVAKSEVMTP